MSFDYNEIYMEKAIELGKEAAKLLEVPIGCVIVYEDKIIGQGYNMRNTKKCALGHAEITAIQEATDSMGDWRLEECTMYVTVEPCPMCAGAILQSRMTNLVIGTMNPKAGCVGSLYNLLQDDRFNHKVKVVSGVLEEECKALMQDFFRDLRENKQKEPSS